MESNLYDAQSGELLWSARSQIYDPSSLELLAEVFANITIARLKGEDVID